MIIHDFVTAVYHSALTLILTKSYLCVKWPQLICEYTSMGTDQLQCRGVLMPCMALRIIYHSLFLFAACFMRGGDGSSFLFDCDGMNFIAGMQWQHPSYWNICLVTSFIGQMVNPGPDGKGCHMKPYQCATSLAGTCVGRLKNKLPYGLSTKF